MDRARISAIGHRWHPIASPVSDENVRLLLRRLAVPDEGRVLDLGCGFGEWLLAAVGPTATAQGVGLDTSAPALEEARRRAQQRVLNHRVRFVEADAATWEGGRFEAVLCIGATHAFGGLAATLSAVRRHLRPGGRVLLGEGFWEDDPTPGALAALGAAPGELARLDELVEEAARQGYEPGFGHVSTPAEWDHYEWAWTGALTEWALQEAPTDADRDEALQAARTHRREWLAGYRGRLGFLTVVLHDVGAPQPR